MNINVKRFISMTVIILSFFSIALSAKVDVDTSKIAFKKSYERIKEKYDLSLKKDKNEKWYETVVTLTTLPESKYSKGINHGILYSMDTGEAKGDLTLIAKDVVKIDNVNYTFYYYKGKLYKYEGKKIMPSIIQKR